MKILELGNLGLTANKIHGDGGGAFEHYILSIPLLTIKYYKVPVRSVGIQIFNLGKRLRVGVTLGKTTLNLELGQRFASGLLFLNYGRLIYQDGSIIRSKPWNT